jgi:anti-anti-sigma regulatory factor
VRRAGVVSDPDKLGSHDHVCWFYDEPEDFAEAANRFLLDGLDNGERLLCVGDVAISSVVDGPTRLPDADRLIHTGRLELLPATEAYSPDGTPIGLQQQLVFYAAAVERAVTDGYRGLRVAAEVTELTRDPSAWDDHLRWEHYADEYIAGEPGMATMCAYRRDAVPEVLAAGLSAVHPLAHGPGADVSFRLFFDDRVLTLVGDVDRFGAPRLFGLLTGTHVDGRSIVLDITRLAFVDAAGAATIAEWGSTLTRRGSTLYLRGASPAFQRVWSLLGLGDAAVLMTLTGVG